MFRGEVAAQIANSGSYVISGYRFLPFLLVTCSLSLAQQPPCQTDIPVSVVLANGGIVRGLNADAFVARSKDGPTIQSVTADSGPRRILFLVETDKRIPA